MIEKLTLAADIAILAWLVGTWFYEGHHKKCEVTLICPHCGNESDAACEAVRREREGRARKA